MQLHQNANPALRQLFDYFSDLWMTLTPVPMWNVYRAERLANNNLEGLHSGFSNAVVQHHTNIWLFVAALQDQHDDSIVSMQHALAVMARTCHPSPYLPCDRMEKRLRKLCRR